MKSRLPKGHGEAKADLHFYGFGDHITDLGELKTAGQTSLTTAESALFFSKLSYDRPSSAVGGAVREVLEQTQGTPLSGILLVTDGASNCGAAPLEAALLAQDNGVPLYTYGVGVVNPKDIIVKQITAAASTIVREKLQVTVHLITYGFVGRSASLELKADGKTVAQEKLTIRADGPQELFFSTTPEAVGTLKLEASITPLPDETLATNNFATTTVRVTDTKVDVLVIEGVPTWDFQYLLGTLKRDRRVRVHAVLLQGDPRLGDARDSVFLNELPTGDELVHHDVIILGDVNPKDLGIARQKALRQFVNDAGGSLIFLAGKNYNPSAYRQTELDTLLPIVPKPENGSDWRLTEGLESRAVASARKAGESDPNTMPIELTPAGQVSPLIALSANPQETRRIWASFPAVDWSAPIESVRPGAQVLLEDPNPAKHLLKGRRPAMVSADVGLGRVLYFGFDEIYRWRSKYGEKYYTQIWSQILQTLSAQRPPGSSALTQLTADRAQYAVGEHIRLTGRLSKPDGTPLREAEVPGQAVAASSANSIPISLQALPDQAGVFQGEFIPELPGSYTFSLKRDPAAFLKFEVIPSEGELLNVRMNEPLLRSLSATSGGRFFREDTLAELPDLIARRSTALVGFRRIPLTATPILLGLVLALVTLEWFLRRHWELK